jgi:hypothetical protein
MGIILGIAGMALFALTILVDLTTYGIAEPAVAGIQAAAIGMMGGGAAEATGGKSKIGK